MTTYYVVYPIKICNNFAYMNDKEIKERIFDIRRAKGYSQEYMANTLGISLNSYRKLEKGNTKIINEKVEQIADILKISCEDLLTDHAIDNALYIRQTDENNKLLIEIERYKSNIIHLEKLVELQAEKIRDLTQILGKKK